MMNLRRFKKYAAIEYYCTNSKWPTDWTDTTDFTLIFLDVHDKNQCKSA